MYKYFLSSILLLIVIFANSQESFNHVLVDESMPSSKNIFVLDQDYYVTVGGTYLGGDFKVSFNKYNLEGNAILNKTFGLSNWSFYHGAENNCHFDDSFFISGTAIITSGDPYDPVDSSFVFLYEIDENLDSITMFSFLHDTLNISVLGMKPTKDGGFVIVGNTRRKTNGALVYENSIDAFMLKVDSMGTQEWYRTFGENTSSHDQEAFYKVQQTPDGGYLCLGYTQSNQWHIETVWDKGDWWLVKTDSLGQEEWSRHYGHPDYDDGRPFALKMASDSTYYAIGAYAKYKMGTFNIYQSQILKLDQNFEEVYEKSYGEASWKNCFFSIIENTENDLVLTGYFQNNTGEGSEDGVMYKLTLDGDSIWRRRYTCHDTLNSLSYPYSIKQTTDGGYVFTGIAYDNELEPAQQIWLVKTDEYGCDGTDWWACATDVMIQEYANSASFKLYPNPASHFVVVTSYTSTTLSNQKVESLAIYDITGKIVKSIAVNGSSGDLKLDVSDLESGVYMVKVGEQMQKLVVE